MMVNWTDLTIIKDYLVEYFFGNTIVFSVFIFVVFSIILISFGLDISFVLSYLVPIIGMFTVSGYLGIYDWYVYIIIIILGLFVGNILNRIIG